jgi:hypothetical protein
MKEKTFLTENSEVHFYYKWHHINNLFSYRMVTDFMCLSARPHLICVILHRNSRGQPTYILYSSSVVLKAWSSHNRNCQNCVHMHTCANSQTRALRGFNLVSQPSPSDVGHPQVWEPLTESWMLVSLPFLPQSLSSSSVTLRGPQWRCQLLPRLYCHVA